MSQDTAFYGRRKGKKLRGPHAALVDMLLPRLAIDLTAPIPDAGALFAQHPSDIWLEIGFGGGEHLAAEARRHPACGFIGCEPFVNGMAKALALIAEADIENIRLHPRDAGALIERLPVASLAGVYLLYPDPWPKRRQRKRRFLSDEMLTRLARVMRPGAELRFATDIDDKAGWTLARILRAPDFDWPAAAATDWQRPWADWSSTRYEAKARAEGRVSAYYTFQRR